MHYPLEPEVSKVIVVNVRIYFEGRLIDEFTHYIGGRST